jgi:hypothetical protein
MANVTYDMMWQEAMAELNEQVHIEDHTMGIPEGVEPPPPPPQVPILGAYQHYACLYIKYMQIFKRMEECYDAMVHPQKRLDVKLSCLCLPPPQSRLDLAADSSGSNPHKRGSRASRELQPTFVIKSTCIFVGEGTSSRAPGLP